MGKCTAGSCWQQSWYLTADCIMCPCQLHASFAKHIQMSGLQAAGAVLKDAQAVRCQCEHHHIAGQGRPACGGPHTRLPGL